MSKKNILYFFTARYPCGLEETFIENEIKIICKYFNHVYIVPSQICNNKPRTIPLNATVVKIPYTYSETSFSESLKFKLGLSVFLLKELIRNPITSDTFRYRISYFKQLYARFYNLKNGLKTKEIKNIVFYTYWFEDWATVLSELKLKGVIESFISRAHGFDIYEERREGNIIPFRKLQLKMVDKVYCASIASMNYLKGKYKGYQSKITYAHLGVCDNGINPISDSEIFTIVSVSNIIPLKRVELITEVLKQLNLRIQWVHFGDGKGLEDLQKQIQLLPENIEVELKGRVSNQEILKFYKSTSVDLFIHLSNSEGGVPVSIQEATSFSIPIIATNAGGISEIVNKQTGVLLDKDFDPEEVAVVVENILTEKTMDINFRKGVREFWKENFDAKKNYSIFIDQLKRISDIS